MAELILTPAPPLVNGHKGALYDKPSEMSTSDRKYDVVLYGASGFTGRQTVEYCRHFAPQGLRWAIAGRNQAKLDLINTAGVDVLLAAGEDADALDRLAAQTRVVATTAGPFAEYGTKLVAACVRNRTHYCDITGETPWIRELIDRHHAQAAADVRASSPAAALIPSPPITARGLSPVTSARYLVSNVPRSQPTFECAAA